MIREYIYLEGKLVGMLSAQRPNVILRIHTDHLGTPRAVSEGFGAARKVLWRFEGDAFGDVLPNEDADGNGISFTMPIRMPGQYFDNEVGISYNYFRDYDPATGRYIESDPIGLDGGMNTYGYVGANALGAVDAEGLEEHTKNQRPSNQQKHEDGQARKNKDAGSEKGDERRDDQRKKPKDHKGPWPPIRIPMLPIIPFNPCLILPPGTCSSDYDAFCPSPDGLNGYNG